MFILHLLTHSILASGNGGSIAVKKRKKKKENPIRLCGDFMRTNTFQHSAKCHLMKFMSNSAKCFYHLFWSSVTFVIHFSFTLSLSPVSTFEMRNEKNTSNSAFQDNVWANCVPIENNPAYHIAVDVAVALRTYEVKKQISFGSKFSFAVNIYSVKLRSNASESHWHKVRMLHWIQNKMRQDL